MPTLGPEVQRYPADLFAARETNLLSGTADASLAIAGACEVAGAQMALADADERRWWVVHTKSRQEKSVARELLDRETPFYLPLIRKMGLRRGRKTSSYIPLFTGYLFMFGSELDRYLSMKTNRVAQFLPVADEGEFVHELQGISRLIDSGTPLTVEARLQAGARVRIKSGALVGVEGTVIERRRKCRVMVAVNLIQRGVSVEIDDFLLEPLD